jgi:hypothetical protein
MTLSQSVEKMRGYYLMYQREAFCAHSHKRSHVEPACSMLQGKCGMRDTGRALSVATQEHPQLCLRTSVNLNSQLTENDADILLTLGKNVLTLG